MARLIDGDYVLSALSIFNDREHGSEHFLYGIETAKEIVENAPTVTGWISVEDKLPEEAGQECWVWCPGWERPEIDTWDGSRGETGSYRDMAGEVRQFTKSGWYFNHCHPVTYWMPVPVPEPPEEVSE